VITEAFNEIERVNTNMESFVPFWINSTSIDTKYYFADKNTGRIYGHIVQDADVWNAVFDYKILGKYISSEFARLAVEREVKK